MMDKRITWFIIKSLMDGADLMVPGNVIFTDWYTILHSPTADEIH